MAAGNTMIPALLALEQLGYEVSTKEVGELQSFVAVRGEESYCADDPVCILGLVKLIEMRTWSWRPTEAEFDAMMKKYSLG
jgi:hypothetical protein